MRRDEAAVMRFCAPIDKDLRSFTRMTVTFTVGLTALALLITGRELAAGPIWIGVPLLIVPLVVALLWAAAPRAYSVDADALRIERLLWTLRLPLGSIRNATVLREGALQGAKRELSGVSLFAHHGRYSSPSLGCFRLYARHWGGPFVLLLIGQEQIVLAPSDVDGFMAALRARAPHVEKAPAGPRAPGTRDLERVLACCGGLPVNDIQSTGLNGTPVPMGHAVTRARSRALGGPRRARACAAGMG
jgi:hypothetical protein